MEISLQTLPPATPHNAEETSRLDLTGSHPPNLPESSTYFYAPLDTSTKTIRLLTLEAPSNRARVRVKLVLFPVERCPSYVALSYCWRSSSPTEPIEIDNSLFEVQENLFRALSQIQIWKKMNHKPRANLEDGIPSTSTWHYFWVDAICINQTNVVERNHQVRLMDSIYRGA